MASRKRYADNPPYPKVQTIGYEKVFKINYQRTVKTMVVNLSQKMAEILNNRK